MIQASKAYQIAQKMKQKADKAKREAEYKGFLKNLKYATKKVEKDIKSRSKSGLTSLCFHINCDLNRAEQLRDHLMSILNHNGYTTKIGWRYGKYSDHTIDISWDKQ